MQIHQGILSELLPRVQVVVMIGSHTSDHLRELARIAECRGRAAYRIESAADLQPRWFCGVEAVGLVIGATGLDPVVRAVRERLDRFSASQTRGMLDGVAR
jgi:4-hydroxy-3-methylbut-2-enyl diphosphate reductase